MTEQALPVAGGQSVTDALIELLRQRQAKGVATYGRSLETFNGRDATRDLKEELIDALQYTMQWEMERTQLIARIDAADARLERWRRVVEAAIAYNRSGYENDGSAGNELADAVDALLASGDAAVSDG